LIISILPQNPKFNINIVEIVLKLRTIDQGQKNALIFTNKLAT